MGRVQERDLVELGVAEAAEVVGEIPASGFIFKDTINVEAFEDLGAFLLASGARFTPVLARKRHALGPRHVSKVWGS